LIEKSAVVDKGQLLLIDTPSSPDQKLSPSLWHALDVWRCMVQLGGGGLNAVVESLGICESHLVYCSW